VENQRSGDALQPCLAQYPVTICKRALVLDD
jgi:hypothetical protein